jgi:hypothetical protein
VAKILPKILIQDRNINSLEVSGAEQSREEGVATAVAQQRHDDALLPVATPSATTHKRLQQQQQPTTASERHALATGCNRPGQGAYTAGGGSSQQHGSYSRHWPGCSHALGPNVLCHMAAYVTWQPRASVL